MIPQLSNGIRSPTLAGCGICAFILQTAYLLIGIVRHYYSFHLFVLRTKLLTLPFFLPAFNHAYRCALEYACFPLRHPTRPLAASLRSLAL